MRLSTRAILPIFILLTTSIAACQSSGAPPDPSPAIDLPTSSPIAPSPLPPMHLIFLAGMQEAALQADQIAASLEAYALDNSMLFSRIDSLDAFQADDSISALVTLGDFPELADRARSNPSIQFISVAGNNASPPSNLFTISAEHEKQAEIAAFLLGYAAALSTDDWRAGVLYTQAEILYANAFLAGVEYFCGACNPVAPPAFDYPQAIAIADPASWQSAAQEMIARGIRTIYLSTDLEIPEIQKYFSNNGLQLLGSTFPTDSIKENWLISISPVSQIQISDQIIQILRGQLPPEDTASVLFSNVDSSRISHARLELLQSILANIEAGFIGIPSDL